MVHDHGIYSAEIAVSQGRMVRIVVRIRVRGLTGRDDAYSE